MPTARLILCEKTSRWAVALRRALGPRQHVLSQTRSLTECSRELASSPASLVAVECTAANLDQVLVAIGEWSRRYPHARMAVVVDSPLEPAEAMLREAGAVCVLLSLRQAPTLSRLARRHLARAPQSELPLRESILERLPWARWASSSRSA